MKRLQILMDDIQEWTGKTFGEGPDRIVPNLKHLQKEVPELIEAIETGTMDHIIRAEFADCFILLLQASTRYGLKAEDIESICNAKMIVNKGRAWGKPDADGLVEHIDS